VPKWPIIVRACVVDAHWVLCCGFTRVMLIWRARVLLSLVSERVGLNRRCGIWVIDRCIRAFFAVIRAADSACCQSTSSGRTLTAGLGGFFVCLIIVFLELTLVVARTARLFWLEDMSRTLRI